MVLVTATGGIQGQPGQAEGPRNPHAGPSGKKTETQDVGNQPGDRPQKAPWAYCYDFQDITHVVLKEPRINMHSQDKWLELTLPSWAVALSLVWLVDGYFHLTADWNPYLKGW